MGPLKLRSHIPIAAPARREAADGAESPFRVVVGFEPRWFHVRCGIDFGKPWHRDADYRRATLQVMRAVLKSAFPGIQQWNGPAERDTCTIAGCFGVCVIPAAFGLPVRYYPDRWPHLEPGHELSQREVEQAEPDRVLSGPFVEQLLAQVDGLAQVRHGAAGFGYFRRCRPQKCCACNTASSES